MTRGVTEAVSVLPATDSLPDVATPWVAWLGGSGAPDALQRWLAQGTSILTDGDTSATSDGDRVVWRGPAGEPLLARKGAALPAPRTIPSIHAAGGAHAGLRRVGGHAVGARPDQGGRAGTADLRARSAPRARAAGPSRRQGMIPRLDGARHWRCSCSPRSSGPPSGRSSRGSAPREPRRRARADPRARAPVDAHARRGRVPRDRRLGRARLGLRRPRVRARRPRDVPGRRIRRVLLVGARERRGPGAGGASPGSLGAVARGERRADPRRPGASRAARAAAAGPDRRATRATSPGAHTDNAAPSGSGGRRRDRGDRTALAARSRASRSTRSIRAAGREIAGGLPVLGGDRGHRAPPGLHGSAAANGHAGPRSRIRRAGNWRAQANAERVALVRLPADTSWLRRIGGRWTVELEAATPSVTSSSPRMPPAGPAVRCTAWACARTGRRCSRSRTRPVERRSSPARRGGSTSARMRGTTTVSRRAFSSSPWPAARASRSSSASAGFLFDATVRSTPPARSTPRDGGPRRARPRAGRRGLSDGRRPRRQAPRPAGGPIGDGHRRGRRYLRGRAGRLRGPATAAPAGGAPQPAADHPRYRATPSRPPPHPAGTSSSPARPRSARTSTCSVSAMPSCSAGRRWRARSWGTSTTPRRTPRSCRPRSSAG